MSKARTLADAVAAGGALRLAELATNGTNTVGLSAPNALAADVTWKLPSADGTNGQALITDGAGNLSWGAGGGGGTGDVTGPASSTDNAVARFDGTTGKLIQNSNFVVSDSGEVTSGTWNGTPIQSATGGTGQTSYTGGQLLIGNNSGGLTKSTLTAGSNVTITNGNGSITIAAGGGLAWQSVQTTGFTAVAGRGYPCNTTSAAFTVTLPASPSAGDLVTLTDYAGTWATNNVTVNPNGGKINSSTSNLILSNTRGSFQFVYVDSTQGWLVYAGFQLAGFNLDYLVVAGGGGGGQGVNGASNAGGGGAGGFRTGTNFAVNLGTSYPLTVGAGGAGATTNAVGSTGGNSVFSTITSAGGGGGGSNQAGANGGSGGGGAAGSAAYSGGTGNTPSTSPSQGNNGGSGLTSGSYGAGGGGGSSATGSNGTGTAGGAGGAGTSSSITGSSVTYAGGGGGGISSGTAGAGGAGGGGNGSNAGGVAGSSGTANTGGGGGGGASSPNGNGGAGGSGVVILKIPSTNTATFSAGVTSSLSTAVSGFKIYTVTATSTTSETVTFS